MESLESSDISANSSQGFSFKEKIEIQSRLIRDACGDSEELQIAWTKSCSNNFRKMITEEPLLHEKYLNDPEGFYEYVRTKLQFRADIH